MIHVSSLKTTIATIVVLLCVHHLSASFFNPITRGFKKETTNGDPTSEVFDPDSLNPRVTSFSDTFSSLEGNGNPIDQLVTKASTWEGHVDGNLLQAIIHFARNTQTGKLTTENFVISSVKDGNEAVYSIAMVTVDRRKELDTHTTQIPFMSVTLDTARATAVVPTPHKKLLDDFSNFWRFQRRKNWVEMLVERDQEMSGVRAQLSKAALTELRTKALPLAPAQESTHAHTPSLPLVHKFKGSNSQLSKRVEVVVKGEEKKKKKGRGKKHNKQEKENKQTEDAENKQEKENMQTEDAEDAEKKRSDM